MFSKKRLFCAVVVFAALICVALLVSGKQPLYAQAPGKPVPNLIGPWELYMPTVCHFTNMVDPTVPAVPLCGTPDDTSTSIAITHQSGRVFAGNHPGASDKLTGYLAADGTVSIHYFSPSAHEREHLFITGTLGIERGTYVMRGYAHGFSELPMPPQPPPAPPNTPYVPYMHTLEVHVVKQ
jgi:hypothetical protein